MSEEASSEARTQPEAPSKQKEVEKNKKFDIREKELESLDSKELGQTLAKGMKQILNQQDRLESRLDDVEEQLEVNEVTVQKKGGRILEKYDERKKKCLIATAFNKGNDGVGRTKIEEIFEVGEDQARKIMKKAGQEYDYLNWHYEGGPISSKLFHRISKTAEDIADLSDIPEPKNGSEKAPRNVQVLEKFGWNKDKTSTKDLEDLKAIKQSLEDKSSQEQKNREVKKRFGSVF